MASERPLRRLAAGLLIAYGLLTAVAAAAPYLGFRLGAVITPLLTLIAFAFALAHAFAALGWPRTLLLLGLTVGVSLAYESIGVATGWVYGPYYYTDKLGPRFLGLVPYLIPVAWFMTIYPAQVIAESLVGDRLAGGWRKALGLAAVSSLVMTAWDVLMDPMMVRLGFWVWEVDGAYFGVPIHNYAGWLATTFSVYACYRLAATRLAGGATERLEVAGRSSQLWQRDFARLAIWSYLITWAGNTMAALRIGLAGPALAGAFSMGALGFVGLLRISAGAQEGGQAAGSPDASACGVE
jgi:putative membrane protein